jgi:Thiamine pyrophosphate enzyme, C-terminal TPP binding domain
VAGLTGAADARWRWSGDALLGQLRAVVGIVARLDAVPALPSADVAKTAPGLPPAEGGAAAAVATLRANLTASAIGSGPVDPVKYAEAFGAKGLMIQSPDQIAPVLKQAFDTPGPVLIGVHVDYRDNHTLFEHVDERSIH